MEPRPEQISPSQQAKTPQTPQHENETYQAPSAIYEEIQETPIQEEIVSRFDAMHCLTRNLTKSNFSPNNHNPKSHRQY